MRKTERLDKDSDGLGYENYWRKKAIVWVMKKTEQRQRWHDMRGQNESQEL